MTAIQSWLFINVIVIIISFTGIAQEIVSFNLREEPVIFVGLNHDFVPYSPRDPTSLKGNIANHGVKPEELAETELKIREEVNYSYCVCEKLELVDEVLLNDGCIF